MKRIFAILMSAIVLLSFAGCSLNELALYNTLKGISNLEKYDFKGELTVDINDLSFEMVGEEVEEDEDTGALIGEMVDSVAGDYLYEDLLITKNKS